MADARQGQPPTSPEAATRNVRRIGLGVLLAAIGAVVTAAGNIEKFVGLLGRIAPVGSERTMAAINHWPWARERISFDLATNLFQQSLCNPEAQPIDMDGDGISADLAVFFSPTPPAPFKCVADTIGDREVAFFRWQTTGYVYVGNPAKRSDDVASWTFAGPALLRIVANSDTPPIEVYILGQRGALTHLGDIETYNDAEQSWIRTKAIDGGALVEAPTGLWRVLRSADGIGSLSHLKLADIMEVDGHSRLLSYSGGQLTIDGEEIVVKPTLRTPAPPTAGAVRSSLSALLDDDDGGGGEKLFVANVTVRPLDRLYLEGCEPGAGLSRYPALFGAYRIDPKQGGEAFCGADDDGGGTTVRIRFAS